MGSDQPACCDRCQLVASKDKIVVPAFDDRVDPSQEQHREQQAHEQEVELLPAVEAARRRLRVACEQMGWRMRQPTAVIRGEPDELARRAAERPPVSRRDPEQDATHQRPR